MSRPPNLKEFYREELEQLLAGWGHSPYRARQLVKWLYKGVTDFEQMTDISRSFRQELAERARISRITLAGRQQDSDGTEKFLFRLNDGQAIESVLIPEADRLTLCLSTQVGCAQGCAFCLTAQKGFVRNLKAAEILDQILAVQTLLPPGRRLTNLVFMGMGEPLANFPALVRALKIITAPWGLSFSPRRVTVATAGLAPLIPRLGQEAPANLTVSLNAPDDATRSLLMPLNRRYPLKTLLEACRAFPLARHRRITFTYVLLAGINDSPQQARSLALLLKGFRSKINLIPLNPHPRLPFSAPSLERTLEFQQILQQAHYSVFIRESRGRNIAAACGQLVGEMEV
jgi:23S rRNA (adenine2503-C2)-methyltransferase